MADRIVFHKSHGSTAFTRVNEVGDCVQIIQHESKDELYDVFLTREEAIAAAKAILKHFDQDWNAYEENISYRYRAPTEEEMAKFLAENPNYKPIPKEVCDPDAPLTSELAQNFG